MTKKEALSEGCTNHGSYYGIPVWMDMTDPACPAIIVKFAPFDYLMLLFHHIEGFVQTIAFPDDEDNHGFLFKIGPAISNKPNLNVAEDI